MKLRSNLRNRVSALVTCALLLCAGGQAGVVPTFVSFSGDDWATETQGGRKAVRDSLGFYHVVYSAYGGAGNPPIVEYVFSLDVAGTIWSGPLPVMGAAPGYAPALGIDSGDGLHLAWSDLQDVWYASAPAASGGLWSQPLNLSQSQIASVFPAIDTDAAAAIHVVWQEVDLPLPQLPDDIFYTSSMDGGVTFAPPLNLTNNLNESERPAIACPWDGSPGSVHVVWDELRPSPSSFQIYHMANSGGGWSSPVLVSQTAPGIPDIEGLGPSLVVDGSDGAHVAYSHWNIGAGPGVLYNQGTFGGGVWTFRNAVMVSPTQSTLDVPNPTLAMDLGGTLRAVWHDDAVPPANPRTLYYSYLEPGFGQWTTPASFVNPDWNCASLVYRNQVAPGGFVVWTDGQLPPTGIAVANSPPLLIELANTPSSARRGDKITWDVTVENRTGLSQLTDVWLDVSGPRNHTKILGTVNLSPGLRTKKISLKVPTNLPFGIYDFSVVIGTMGSEDWDRGFFQLQVVP